MPKRQTRRDTDQSRSSSKRPSRHTSKHKSRSPRRSDSSAQRTRTPKRSHEDPFKRGGRLTLFGRKPVYEALSDPRVTAQKLFIARHARGEMIEAILRRADQIALPVERLSAMALSRISKHGKQDQGVALDVQAPLHLDLAQALDRSTSDLPIFLLDGLTTPANLGMVIRSVWASGAAGIILPREGCSPLNPLAVKASAGVAIHAAIWDCQSAIAAVHHLNEHQIPIFGLAGEATRSLYTSAWPQRSAWVIGNESVGMSAGVRAHLTDVVSLPMAGDVESLNAAAAATVVAFELSRQRGDHA